MVGVENLDQTQAVGIAVAVEVLGIVFHEPVHATMALSRTWSASRGPMPPCVSSAKKPARLSTLCIQSL